MGTNYPGSHQIPVQKYNGHPRQAIVDAAYNTDQYVAQQKMDGAFYALEKVDSEHIYLFARTVSRKTGELVEKSANVPHIVEWAKNNLPDDTVLLGEIYVVGGHSNDVTKLMGCLPRTAIKRQFDTDEYGGPLHYYVFDCLYWEGKNLVDSPFIVRYNYINEKMKTDDYIELALNIEGNFEEAIQKIFAAGGEGVVFKKKTAPYKVGGRTTDEAFKVKEHIDTLDVICIGIGSPVRTYSGKEIETWPYWIKKDYWNEETNSWVWTACEVGSYYDGYLFDSTVWEPVTKPWYYEWAGSIRLGVYDGENIVSIGTVASGLTDELRAALAESPQDYIGKIVEISCMSVNSKDKTIRHPVFLRFRDDKPAEDCTVESVFGK